MDAGVIAQGAIDTRSIEDVTPDDLKGFTQCHFFAGIGGWSYALRIAGWPDTRPVWTGSCPCQPFSAAGKGLGFADERHLWPSWFWLIQQCRPRVIFGEQVDKATAWLDLVATDLEGEDYACGPVVLPAAGIGAPHGRHRMWFVADTDRGADDAQLWTGQDDSTAADRSGAISRPERRLAGAFGGSGDVAHSASRGAAAGEQPRQVCRVEQSGETCSMGHTAHVGHERRGSARRGSARRGGIGSSHASGDVGSVGNALCERRTGEPLRLVGASHQGPATFWSDADWIYCRDGKYRPVEPFPQQMADGLPERMGPVCPTQIQDLTEEILAYGRDSQTDPREALRAVWKAHEPAALLWPSRRLSDISEAPLLLAFMRQLADQGWALAEGVLCSSAEASESALRGVRLGVAPARSPRRRELAEQRPEQLADAVCVLSSILARHAEKTWGDRFRKDAAAAFVLSHGVTNRVGRLRAYGNAIVPSCAAEVIEAYCEVRGL
jgi:DNA (cytosine-5)-methyltransferase 1